ncbi:MAG: RluA family pseudouridine synthase [Bacteroidota bacterium]
MKKQVQILHEDHDLVIVNKPADYLSIPDRHDETKPNVLSFLNHKFGKIFTVHRLDKPTSGILCFAKNEAAHKQLSQQFQARTVEKIYYALVDGILSPTEGKIDQAIAPHPARPGKMMVSNKGKKSLTTYKVVEQFQTVALVEANIKTGRTHQIRVHFESIGYPLTIDEMYGNRTEFNLSTIKRKKFKLGKDQDERPLMSRTTLHAFRLELDHPTTQKRLVFEAPLPKDFAAVLKQLQKWHK